MLGRVTNLAVYLNPVPELQGEPEDISREKARLAAREVKLQAIFFPIAMVLLPNFLELRFFQLLCFFFTISGVSFMHKRNIKGGDSSFPVFEIHGFQLLCFGKP
jgi:hypothetical protein